MRMDVGTLTMTLLRVGFGVGLVLAMASCAREDFSGQPPGPADPLASGSAAAVDPVPTPQAVLQLSRDRDQFRRTLARKFDVSRVVMQQASTGDGTLHVPNGRVAHAVVAVKNADGTVSRHCLSSSAEVEALMNQSGDVR